MDFRWNWLQSIDDPLRFLSLRDDRTFVLLNATHTAEPSPIEKLTIRRLAPALASAITSPDQLDRVLESNILEIRQYRIRPGQRDRFATFFRDHVLESHVDYGMPLYAQFDDLDDENVFVFLRGFTDMVDRDRRKNAYYRSPLWLNELQDEAFSMIDDYSNVLLVTPVR